MVKIYKQPFAHEGDAIAIPDASQPDGKMSSADGWTPDYQLPKTDPNYKPVGRQEMNGVFKEVTEALGEVQVQGAASWSADGAPYPINAQVYHSGKQWLALRANSVAPAEGADWTGLVGKQYVDASIPDLAGYLQPSITGSCTTNGTTDNTLALTGIVPALALETGDVIQITGSTGGLNDKLFTVESITDDNSIIVNYEHAGNRGDGSLKLADETATVTIKRIAKWFNAPLGMGQAWVETSAIVQNTVYVNTLQRTLIVQNYASQASGSGGDVVQWEIRVSGGGAQWEYITSSANQSGSMSDVTVPYGCEYRYIRPVSALVGGRKELR